uniref:XK-related protein n=1 Tax=Schistosoma mansoni TaxID=6183 RepID=A0A5K4FC31_SCHMA
MMHKFRIGKVDNLWTQRVRYNLERFKEASINQRQYSDNEDIFTLNVLAITVLQFAITFGGTYLFILVQQISEWIKHHETILWVSSAIYLVLQLIWMFVPALSRKYPYNIMYLILMIVLTVAGAIALPFTLFNLLCEVKMVFGGGEFRYKQADLVLASGILYNC